MLHTFSGIRGLGGYEFGALSEVVSVFVLELNLK
jgi:hypothetical protein